MSTQLHLPKIKPTEEPSIVNHEAGKWGFLSGIAAALVSIPYVIHNHGKEIFGEGVKLSTIDAKKYSSTTRNVAIFVTIAELVGALAGGLKGKAEQERELKEGRVVKTPGYWNKGIMSGLFCFGLGNAPFSLLQITETNIKPARIWPGIVLPLTAATIGSVMRKNSLQHDYDKAVALHNKELKELKTLANSLQPETYKDSVSLEESAALHEKHAAHAHQHAHKVEHAQHHHNAAEHGV